MLQCYITGKSRKETPEELVRQEFARLLVEDYGYAKENICFEYPILSNPSDSRKNARVDIAVLENGLPKIFVETKQPTKKNGVNQLKNYMSWEASVRYGVWTNGNGEEGELGVIYIEKYVDQDTFRFRETYNIPIAGITNLEEHRPQVKDLLPSTNLKNVFRQMRGYIAANATGTTRDEKILNELMSIVMCKVYDERYKASDDFVDFYVVQQDHQKTADHIKRLFEEGVKGRYTTVFEEQDTITLDDSTITYVVSQLERYSLLHSPSQVISDAFESIISYASKGSQGQFFTPANVIDLMVAILAPDNRGKLIDPAAGTAGFLSSTMRYVWANIDAQPYSTEVKREEKHEYASEMLFGIEKDAFLAKMSKAYMTILGDGKSGIFVADSLVPTGWSHATQAKVMEGEFDYVLTNPPFGKDIKVRKEVVSQYYSDKIDLMFVEQSLKLLKDGGVLGIVLPETIFHSPQNKDFRERFFYPHNIQCLIDLPHDTFRPYNNAKCDVIFLQKNRPQQSNVLCVCVNKIGHNHLGQPLYYYDKEKDKFDTTRIQDDIPALIQIIQASFQGSPLRANLKQPEHKEHQQLTSDHNEAIRIIPYETIRESDVLVARNYFAPLPKGEQSVSLGQLMKEGIIHCFDGHGSPRGFLKGEGSVPYIRVKDVVNLELYINEQDLIPEYERERLFNPSKALCTKDIIFVRRGSYRIGDVGILYEKDLNSILTRELLVIRVVEADNRYGITPFNLLYLLNSDPVKCQLPHKIMMDTTLPNIAERWMDLSIPLDDQEHMKALSNKMEEVYNLRCAFWNKLQQIADTRKPIEEQGK